MTVEEQVRRSARELTKKTGLLHTLQYLNGFPCVMISDKIRSAEGKRLMVGDTVWMDNVYWTIREVSENANGTLDIRLRYGGCREMITVENCKDMHYRW